MRPNHRPPAEDNVERLVGPYLCRGCGTCVAVCPHGSISLHVSNTGFDVTCDRSCSGCGLCLAVCPALTPPELPERADAEVPERLIGECRAAYIGFARDGEARRTGTSGGIATELLIHGLEAGVFDGAIVSRLDQAHLACSSFIAQDRHGLMEAAGSKYCPSSTNALLRETPPEDCRRLALVGLPCQMTGAKKARPVSKRFHNIELRIGLFCSHGITTEGLPFLLGRYARGREGLERVVYRAQGWPGSLVMEYASGPRVTVPLSVYWGEFFGPYFFAPYGCLLCCDLAAEDADISLGDAWLPEIRRRDHIGTSIVVVRSERGAALVKEASASGRIALAKIDPAEVVRAQRGILARKKVGIAARLRLARLLGLAGGQPGPRLPKTTPSSLMGAALVYTNAWVSSTAIGRRVLTRMPSSVLRCYGGLVLGRSGSL